MRKSFYFFTIMMFLTAIGAINWGLVGLFKINIITEVFSEQAYYLVKFLYILIGFSGLITLYLIKNIYCLNINKSKIEPTIRHNVAPKQVINSKSSAKPEQEKFISEGGNSQPTNINVKD